MDTFTFKGWDGYDYSAGAAVTITVENAVPEPSALSFATGIDTEIPITLIGNDADGHALTWEIVDELDPAAGTVTPLTGDDADWVVTFTPDTGYTGEATFTYRVHDGFDYSETVTVTVTIGRAHSSRNEEAAHRAASSQSWAPRTSVGRGVTTPRPRIDHHSPGSWCSSTVSIPVVLGSITAMRVFGEFEKNLEPGGPRTPTNPRILLGTTAAVSSARR